MHQRFAPKRHRFVYRIFLFGIDLDELGALSDSVSGFSVNRRNVYSFLESDYFPSQENAFNASGVPRPSRGSLPLQRSGGLKSRVERYLAERGVDIIGGRVVLLTLPRVFGYLFNPVSFYFCYDRTGQAVASIAEVTNTFREMKLFLLGPAQATASGSDGGAGNTLFRLRVAKHFYVSPYSDVDVAFDFKLRPPGDRLAVQIDDYAGEQRLLTSTLTGTQKPLSTSSLFSATLRHPLISLKIISLIHWHALLLLTKRVPWFRKADRPDAQRHLYRPHASLASTS